MKKSIDSAIMTSSEYRRFIEDLKARVTSARISAARAVNRDLILLYWDIGHGIVEKQKTLGWGDAVVEIVAADLRRAFPEMRGFSLANVWRMRQLHLAYTSDAILAQAARELENRTPPQGMPSFMGHVVPESSAIQATSGGDLILAQAVRELVAAVPLQSKLPASLKGRLPTARQLADVVRAAMPQKVE
jgi:hypothetical protein